MTPEEKAKAMQILALCDTIQNCADIDILPVLEKLAAMAKAQPAKIRTLTKML